MVSRKGGPKKGGNMHRLKLPNIVILSEAKDLLRSIVAFGILESIRDCHPERSEGSAAMGVEMLRGVYTERSECAQHDSNDVIHLQ